MEKAGTVSKQNTKIRFFREADGIPPNPCRKKGKKTYNWSGRRMIESIGIQIGQIEPNVRI
jgi:hypothetical protein